MKIEVHHYHEFGADEMKILTAINHNLVFIKTSQAAAGRKLEIMSQQENELGESIKSLRQTTTEGFQDIGDAVNKAAQRVIQRLESKQTDDIDLSDEIDLMKGLQSSVRQSAADATTKLNEIAKEIAGGGAGEAGADIEGDRMATDVDSTRDQLRTPVRQPVSDALAASLEQPTTETAVETTAPGNETASDVSDAAQKAANQPFDPSEPGADAQTGTALSSETKSDSSESEKSS